MYYLYLKNHEFKNQLIALISLFYQIFLCVALYPTQIKQNLVAELLAYLRKRPGDIFKTFVTKIKNIVRVKGAPLLMIPAVKT